MGSEDGKRHPERGVPDAGPSPETPADAAREEEKRAADIRALAAAVDAPGVTPEAALGLVETFDAEAVGTDAADELAVILEDYGLAPDDLPGEERGQLAALWLGARDGRSERARRDVAGALDHILGERLMRLSFGKIDRLTKDLRGAGSAADLKDRLRDVMRTLARAAKHVPLDEDHEEEWEDIDGRFRALLGMKAGAAGEVRDAFSDVFEEHADFIEDELVAARLEKRRDDVQKVTQELYGRTKEEVEEIKWRNRGDVVMLIREFGNARALDVAMLEKLHEANNRGIVPKRYSQVRHDPGALPPTFFERIGLLSEDLGPELEDLMKEANDLRDKEIGDEPGQISKEAFAIRAAQLHNDLLDMHPFGDRNGSTALLFLETVMTAAGHDPSPRREKDFYKNIEGILGGQPTAMAIVREEQARMASEPGYFVGESNKDPAQRRKYDRILNVFRSLAGKPPARDTDEGE